MGIGSDINDSKQVVEPVDDCRICLEPLANKDDDRTSVKMRCNHQYHLDCIGSAFTEKNKMQCPTCRQVEKGEWLYAQRKPPVDLDINIDDLMPTPEQVALGLSPEMPSMGLHGPVWRDNVMSYAQRHLYTILPNSARSTSSAGYQTPNNGFMMFDGWGRVSPSETMRQQHQLADHLALANEHRSQEMTMYGYGGSSRGTSNGGGSSSGVNSNGEAAALANGGDTNRSGECVCGFCDR